MEIDDRTTDETDTDITDGGKVRQLLHAATGDRDAEARALSDRAGDDVDQDDAKRAVAQAHGDRADRAVPERDVASPDDARAAQD
jgi:hypothetical protein